MDHDGILGITTGMKTTYLGGFMPKESQFVKFIYKTLNWYTACYKSIPTEKLLSGSDLHLFSGSSEIGTTRVDINPNTTATHHMTVQKFFEKNKKTFDLIIIDPPYNADYDKRYGTSKLNVMKESPAYIEWLSKECLKILNPGGILISKNWRSVMPEGCSFLGGIVTFFGGYRRVTILEAWQKARSPSEEIKSKIEKYISDQGYPKIRWTSDQNEMARVFDYKSLSESKSPILITCAKKNVGIESLQVDDFIASKKKRDLILLESCIGVGGSTKKTNLLKEILVKNLYRGGVIATMTYFNPVLTEKGLELLEQVIIFHEDHAKIDMLSIYRKP